MNFQKFINIYIFLGVILSVCLAKFFWGWIDIGYVKKFEIIGEYSKFKYNPINETIRYVTFISLPLIVYLICIKIFRGKEIKKIKEIFFYDNSKISYVTKNNLLGLYFLIFLVLISLNFLSINLPSDKIDIFHEGQWLTAVINYLKKGGYWIDSYITQGLFNEILSPLIGFKIFDILSIGSSRFSTLLSILVFKIFLIIFIYKLTTIQRMTENFKILFFILISLIALYMTNYNLGILSYRELPLIIFLILLIPIISNEKMTILYCFLIGVMSVISMLWGIDRGAYLNLTLASLILFLFIKKDFRKSSWIIIGITVGWILFYTIIGPEEFKSFLYNTKEIYQTQDWIHGYIHPEPFSSDQHSSRATKILLILILSGLLIINLNFFKYKNISNESKILLIFIFIISVVTYKTALTRSDGPHIRSVTGFPLLLLCIIILNLIFDFILKNEKYLKIFQNITNFKSAISLMLITFSIFIFFIFNLNFKNIISFESRVKNYVNLGDEFFLSENQNLLIKRYNDLTIKDECVLIFTYESAIPYLLKKPSCSKYYFVHTIGSNENQNLFIKSVENRKPNFILLGGEYINIGFGPEPQEMFPIIYNFLLKNYQLNENILRWSIYKLKLS
jgi:hypothetical protein